MFYTIVPMFFVALYPRVDSGDKHGHGGNASDPCTCA